ncbi:MAG: winged helix-turn-helix transcriptional regulator [Candidatus Paracaedibacteraceae bacterium]|nr:winged helix-turn-helix transcriptional regulator [Candidatus Paracaedibacteraceae bacterium]
MTKLPFGFDTPEDSPGFLLWQTWHRQIKKVLEEYSISHAQFVIMATLMWFGSRRYDMTQVLIVNQTKPDKMTVSKSLKKLVGMSLVERHENQDDTRAKSVKLTKSGLALTRKLVPIVENVDSNFFGKLSKKQEKDLIVILRKLTGNT